MARIGVTVIQSPRGKVRQPLVDEGEHAFRRLADREEVGAIPPEAEALLIDKVARHIGRCQELVLSDYLKGC
jgi:bifunctional ADP-heptose synthase (sugar kinase/adenylyltransferase)